MGNDRRWLHYSEDLDVELQQAADEGKDIASLTPRVQSIKGFESRIERDRQAAELLDDVQRMTAVSVEFDEPDSLSEILAQRPAAPDLPDAPVGDELYNRVLGAWQARCAGCLLGKPVEGWKRQRIEGLLRDTGNYPPSRYMSSDVPEPILRKYAFGGPDSWRGFINEVDGMPVDDDTNYTMLGLLMVEKHGYELSTNQVASWWMRSLPIMATCTAERVAYRNIVMGVLPPHSGRFRNPYREWIGAQIRADMYGYICPGNPEKAAALAHADARLSHTRNGIYGAMYVAAMIAAAFTTTDVRLIVQAGLAQIPANSRLAVAVSEALDWSEMLTWQEAVNKVHQNWDENNGHHWCHTVSNAIIVTFSLLYAGENLERAIGMALVSAFDTDCNCATVGSIIGAMAGAKLLPPRWIAPLNDKLHTSLAGQPTVSITEMARRTCAVISGG